MENTGCDYISGDYDSFKVVSDILKDIGYSEIGNYLYKNRDNQNFFDSCVNLILHKTPEQKRESVSHALHVSGVLDIF